MKKREFLKQAQDVSQTDSGLVALTADMEERNPLPRTDMMAGWLDWTGA